MPKKISNAECKKLQRIRARASYLLFRQLYDFLNKNPSVVDVLRKFYNVLDSKKSFGSKQNAAYAAESLSLVLRDNHEMNDEFLEQEWPDKEKSQTKSKTRDIEPEKLFGNFILISNFNFIWN